MKQRKVLALLLVLALALSLMAGCGTAASSTEPSESAASEAAASEAVSDSEPEAEEPSSPAANVVALDSSEEGTAGQTVAVTVGDPMEAMAEEYISYPLEGESNTITMWYYIPMYVDFMDSNYSFNAIPAAEEATGVSLEFIEVSSSSADTQFDLMVASGDMPDLIPAREYYTAGLSKAYEEDIILAIDDYIDEYMPNYAAVMETLDAKTVDDTKTDGMTLAFSIVADGTYSANGVITRGDWLTEQGIEFSGDLISLDEFTDMMRTFHSAYDTPYTYYMYDGQMPLEAAFDTEIPALKSDGFMTMVTSAIFRKGDEVMSGWTTDGYRKYLEWILQMFDEGVLYADFLSIDTDQQVQNFAIGSGEVAVWQANADKMEEVVGIVDGQDEDYSVAAVPRIVADPTSSYVWNDEVSLVTTNSGFSISSSCKQPELVCQWENFFWTTDGYLLANYGIEGESYHMEGDTPVFDWDQPVTVTGRNAPNAEMAQQLFTMMRFVGFYSDNDRLLPTFSDSALAAVELWTVEDSSDDRNYPSALSSSLTVEENEAIAEYEADFLTYADEQILKFLDGAVELNDETWTEYVETCNSMGLTEIIAVYQSAYDQYLAGER